MSESNNLQTDTEILKEILKWIRFAGMKEVKAVLTSELDNDVKKQVYQLSDGNKARADILNVVDISAGAVSSYWKKWLKLGLGETKAVSGGDRFVRSFDLDDFGIKATEIKAVKPAKTKTKTKK